MDINEMRSLITVAGLVCFLVIGFWAYSSKRRKDFDEAANLPFSGPNEDDNDTAEKKQRP